MTHNYDHRTFMIFNINEVSTTLTDEFGDEYTITTSQLDDINFNQVLETSKYTVRKSVDGLKALVKWEGETTPPTIEALIDKLGPYNYEEIVAILATSEWTSPEEI